MTMLPERLSAAEMVAAAFKLKPHALFPGDVVKTAAGKFQVEAVQEEPAMSQVVLLTGAPGLEARLGMTATQGDDGECSVVLHTSVHPYSWVGRVYFRVIEPFHHLLVERVLLPRLRKRAQASVT
jgi:hypothetical protein